MTVAEYVFDFDGFEEPDIATGLREPVVRCRNCAYTRKRWNAKAPACLDWFFCAYWGGREMCDPDGFCAWGEPRGNPCRNPDEGAAAPGGAPAKETAGEPARTPAPAPAP